jgi:two-component system sensor histidine kinase MprB
MSLRLRLLAIVAITFAVVVAGCVYAAHVSANHELRSETDRFLLQRSKDERIQHGLEDSSRGNRGSPFGSRPEAPPQFAEPDAYVQLIRSDGTVEQTPPVAVPIDARDRDIAQHNQPPRFRSISIDGTPYRVLTVHVSGGAAQIARSIKETNDVLSTLDVRLLMIALIGTAVAALLAWIIARRIVRPVEQLTSATERVAQTQDLESTINVSRRDELGRLATSFNTMLVALRTSRAQQQRLVMDASHELRTPLTALRTNVEVLQRATMDNAERAEMLAAVDLELAELTELVTELVDLATDARADELPQPTGLGDLAERVVARMRRLTGREITLTVGSDATVNAQGAALERALSNLVDNACKFSPAGTPVDVTVAGTQVDVADRGPGVAEADRAHVFDRFYRAPEARTMPGSGLGLSIVKQVVDRHGGTVDILRRAGGGTVARITLPA